MNDVPQITLVMGSRNSAKTHLLRAIEYAVTGTHPDYRIEFMQIDELLSGLVSSIRAGQSEDYLQKLSELDLLIIDDIQRLARKTESMNWFASLLNTDNRSSRIVLSCCGNPADISDIPEHLLDALFSGIVVSLPPIDPEAHKR